LGKIFILENCIQYYNQAFFKIHLSMKVKVGPKNVVVSGGGMEPPISAKWILPIYT